MTPLREAIVLPLLFLTVVLLGGLRVSEHVRLVPPPLVALVLGMLLLGALVRSRAVRPERLLHARRTSLENLTGAAVLVTLFAASAQVFHLVTPDRGLLHAIFTLFFFVQLLTTLAAIRDRDAIVRSLTVLLGAAFVIRFIVLEALYAPEGGFARRVVTTVMEGVTLGALGYDPHAAVTGYIAFLALVLYLAGVVLLGLPDAPAGSLSPARALPSQSDSSVLPILPANRER